MARALTVKQIGGDVVGTVSVDGTGLVTARADEAGWEVDLKGVVARLMESGVFLITAGPSTVETDSTRAVPVRPGDAGFLEALADAITRADATVGGRRVRACLESSATEGR